MKYRLPKTEKSTHPNGVNTPYVKAGKHYKSKHIDEAINKSNTNEKEQHRLMVNKMLSDHVGL